MEKRGRPSTADAAVRVVDGKFGARPNPPDDLTEQEQTIWRDTVASEAVDMFATAATKAILKDYCRHRASCEKLTRVINLFQDDWLRNAAGAKRYRELLKARDGEARAAVGMATKLRITNQSRYDDKTSFTASKKAAKGFRPWDAI